MEKFLLSVMLFVSTAAWAEPVSQQEMETLSSAIDTELDEVLKCLTYTIPVHGMSSVLGQLIGQMWHRNSERAEYWENYINPIVDVVDASVSTVLPAERAPGSTEIISPPSDPMQKIKATAEYQTLLKLTQEDRMFTKCPERTVKFMSAVDVFLVAVAKK